MLEAIKLSERLRQVAEQLPHKSRLLDVGTDHAYLPIYLTLNGQVNFVIAGEVVDGPYQSARVNVASFGLTDKISVRKGSGLSVFDPSQEQVDAISITGMGGQLIADILDADKAKLEAIQLLVLQPNNGEATLRGWLMRHGFELVKEVILSENDKIYEILVARPGHERLAEKDLLFGPYLLREQSPVFRDKWQKELQAVDKILTQIPAYAKDKRQAFEGKASMIREVLNL